MNAPAPAEFGPPPRPDGWTASAAENDATSQEAAAGGSPGCQYTLAGKPVVIQEGSGAVVGTGCVVSGSAVALVAFLQRRRGELGGGGLGDVLELGSGTGVVAIGAALLGGRVVATDVPTNPHGWPEAAAPSSASDADGVASGRFTDLLDVIRHNAARSRGLVDEAGGAVEAAELLWGDAGHIAALAAARPAGFDHILGCNISYQTASYEALVGTILALSCPRTRTYLATTDNLGDNALLTSVAEAAGLRVELVHRDASSYTLIFELSLSPREGGAGCEQ